MAKDEAVTNHRGMGEWLEAPRFHKAFVPFGDRLDFLSPERQQLQTGKLRILPPRQDRERDRATA